MKKSVSPNGSRPYMPEYGLRKGSKALPPWKWAAERLKRSRNYWIVTTRPDGRPHLMMVWGLWMDGGFYFSTGRESRKAKNLVSNEHSVIATGQADPAVIVEGIAQEVGDVELRRRFVRIYEKKYDWDRSSFKEPVLSLKEPVYLVRPTVTFGLDERKSLNVARRWKFRILPEVYSRYKPSRSTSQRLVIRRTEPRDLLP